LDITGAAGHKKAARPDGGGISSLAKLTQLIRVQKKRKARQKASLRNSVYQAEA
jgi:hypothetical protein